MGSNLSRSDKSSLKSSSTALILTCLTGGAAVTLTVICIPFVLPALRRVCLPYVPATSVQVENVMAALSNRSRTGQLVDIGSGDGRIVVAAAHNGFISHGVELNPWLVLYSRIIAFRSGVSRCTSFYCCDLWKFSLAPYNNIIIFGVEEMMDDLEQKMRKELKSGTQVVACRFPLPNRHCLATFGSGVDQVWVYSY